jgi:hypothetical protein
MTPKSGRPEAKFLVPSMGSMMKERSAVAILPSRLGAFSAASSPMIRADGKALERPAAISISKAESFLPHRVALDAGKARHDLRPGRRGDDVADHERIAARQ